MRSYRLEGTSGTKCLVMREEAQLTPKPHEIVVRVRATSLNRRDTMILNGTYPLTPRQGVIPLSDGAGEVVAVGDSVTRFAVGDRITGSYFARWIDGRINAGLIDQLGCTLDGMLAEYAVLDEQWAVRLPDHLDWHQAATLTCAGLTAWNAVTAAEMPKPGQWVLVIGSGGVALFALQFAKLLGLRAHRASHHTGCERRDGADPRPGLPAQPRHHQPPVCRQSHQPRSYAARHLGASA